MTIEWSAPHQPFSHFLTCFLPLSRLSSTHHIEAPVVLWQALLSLLSLSLSLSLSIPCSVSLSKPFSHTLSPRVRRFSIKKLQWVSGNKHQPHWPKQRQDGGSQLGGGDCNTRGHTVASQRCTTISDHFWWRFWVPISSSPPPLQNNTLRSGQKWLDSWHVFLWKMIKKNFQLIRAK